MDPACNTPLSEEDAEEIIKGIEDEVGRCKFDYLNGRVMKISLEGNELYTRSYNNDIGEGAAERVITELRRRLANELVTTRPDINNTAQGTQMLQLPHGQLARDTQEVIINIAEGIRNLMTEGGLSFNNIQHGLFFNNEVIKATTMLTNTATPSQTTTTLSPQGERCV